MNKRADWLKLPPPNAALRGEQKRSGWSAEASALALFAPPITHKEDVNLAKPSHNEYIFINAIHNGEFSINVDGVITRNYFRRGMSICTDGLPALVPYFNSRYPTVVYGFNGKIYNLKVHRIVWIYYNGKIPDGYELNHIDGDKYNFKLSNLEVVTHSENCIHAYHITQKACRLRYGRGENNMYAKINENEAVEIYNLYHKEHKRICEIRNIINNKISRAAIGGIVHGRRWTHLFK